MLRKTLGTENNNQQMKMVLCTKENIEGTKEVYYLGCSIKPDILNLHYLTGIPITEQDVRPHQSGEDSNDM